MDQSTDGGAQFQPINFGSDRSDTVPQDGGDISSGGHGHLLVEIETDFVLPALVVDSRAPSIPGAAPAYACGAVSAVPKILAEREDAEVGPLIIETIPIDMVDDHPRRRLSNETVHVDCSAWPSPPSVSDGAGLLDLPSPLADQPRVVIVDDSLFA
jgi:hypothetical protein